MAFRDAVVKKEAKKKPSPKAKTAKKQPPEKPTGDMVQKKRASKRERKKK